MKKLLIIVIMLNLIANTNKAQQLPQFTQYMFNDYIMNPAVAGMRDFYQAKANYRYQWMGIQDAPVTYVLSLFGPHRTKSMGFGGYIYNDVTGPTSRSGYYASYSYILKLKSDLRLSFGLALGILQFKIDGTKIDMLDIIDPSFQDQLYVKHSPDATFGIHLRHKKYWASFSSMQLLNNKIEAFNPSTSALNKLKTHFYLSGGYNYEVNKKLSFEPSAIIKYVGGAPASMELSAKATYASMVWTGFSFRTADAVALLVGYNYKNQLFFGYAYDVPISSIKKHTSGSHEIMVTVRFNKIKNLSSKD